MPRTKKKKTKTKTKTKKRGRPPKAKTKQKKAPSRPHKPLAQEPVQDEVMGDDFDDDTSNQQMDMYPYQISFPFMRVS